MSLDAELRRELDAVEALGRRRDLDAIDARAGGVDFVSNDYLGLARDPRVVAAAHEALERCGAGGRAARLLGGGADADALEREVADWLGAEAALSFPSGYQANVGVIA
ncbi:MAG: pyridoxal phosphate-dependent aminotransferase family protein, partial [Planctomycetes bacterium]|nr:pyridoxal phosphate-dependent aminotransferase family protein [Planctomycetota bacterium]